MEVRCIPVDARGGGCGAGENGSKGRAERIPDCYCGYSFTHICAKKVIGQHGALGRTDMAALFLLVLFSNSGVSQNYQMHEEPGFVVVCLYFVCLG